MRSVFLLLACFATITAGAQTPAGLNFDRTIQLSGVSGKFDHFAVDLAGHRLFAAATGNHSVEVVDLNTDKVVQSITGLGKPHGLAWVASSGSLYVADGTLAELRAYKGSPLALAGKIDLSDDADDMAYDSATQTLFVGHGGSDGANPARIALVDTAKFTLVADLPVASHPEALELDPAGGRVFANLADSNEIAVLSTASRKIETTWKLENASDNVPVAYDGSASIVYVACRKPPTLLAVDARTGRQVSKAPSGAGADDLFFDAALHRLYLISGAGEVDAYDTDPSGTLGTASVTRTESGAKTALFVPALRSLFVGVPGVGGHPAEIRVFHTAPLQASR
jgi:DNA-binding beta-propeller fold protein YncE